MHHKMWLSFFCQQVSKYNNALENQCPEIYWYVWKVNVNTWGKNINGIRVIKMSCVANIYSSRSRRP